MKKLITTCVLIAAASFASFAQSKQAAPKSATKNSGATATASASTSTTPNPQQVAERRAKMYQQQYGLTADQYKGVYQAELDYQTQLNGFKTNGQELGAGPAMQMEMGRDQRFKSVMTADQYSKYESSKPKTN